MKNIDEIIKSRHSVRRYKDNPIEEKLVKRLNEVITKCNQESGLNIQLILNDGETFDRYKLHYGQIHNCKNYIALVGKKEKNLDEKAGYYGQRIVLEAQLLGLNTCWVAGGYKRGCVNAKINSDEKLVCVIALGYGTYQGKKPNGKSYKDVTSEINAPKWFKKGVEYALLAPTAMNQQKFKISLLNDNIVAIKPGIGPMVKIDLGIVKYHFELGAGIDNFQWQK